MTSSIASRLLVGVEMLLVQLPPQYPIQVDNMTNKWFVFMTKDGRISLAGLNSAKVDRLADAIVDSFKA